MFMKSILGICFLWIATALHPSLTVAKDLIALDARTRDAVLLKVPADMKLIKEYLKDPTTSWQLHRGDLHLQDDWPNGDAIVVDGNVIVDGTYDDRRAGIGMLLVLGDMQAKNVVSWGALAVTGKLTSPGLVYAYYNDYTFEAMILEARAFVSNDKAIYIGDRKSGLYLTDRAIQTEEEMTKALSVFSPEVIAPALDDFFGDKVWGVIPDYDACRQLLLDNKSVFRNVEAPKSLFVDVSKMISSDVSDEEVRALEKKDPLLKLLSQMR